MQGALRYDTRGSSRDPDEVTGLRLRIEAASLAPPGAKACRHAYNRYLPNRRPALRSFLQSLIQQGFTPLCSNLLHPPACLNLFVRTP